MKKYYQPSIEDLFIGYECETCVLPLYDGDPGGFFGDTILDDSNIRAVYDEDWAIQTKYLDKEDVESLGWKYSEDAFHRKIIEEKGEVYNPTHYWFVCNGYGLTWYPNRDTIQITDDRQHFMMPIIVYSGPIKSINELRKLMQWLNIKDN